MAPTYQDVGTFQVGGAVQLTVPWPTHAVDDIAFLFVQSNSDVGLLTANGFVQVPDSPQSGTASVMSVWWCRATSTSMASPVTNTGNNNISAGIVTVRGAITTGDPWEVTSGAATAVITTVSITGDTTTIADQLIIYADGRGSDVAGGVFSGEADSNVTGLAERVDNGTATGNGGGIGVWTATKATAGAYGPLTCTALGVAGGQAHWTASIKPASSGQNVTGTLYTQAPTFFTGAVTPGAVALTGTLFASTPIFSAGVVTSGTPLTGTLYVSAPTFFAGVVTPGTVALTGTLYTNTPTFPAGAVSLGSGDQALTGTLFTQTPTFPAGVLTSTYALTGTLFQRAPTFFAGRVQRAVPTGLLTNEIGVMGHSNVGTFIDYYRSISARDLLTPINHGSYDAETWGDPANGSYAAAWAKLDDDEPVGGYRAFWVMLGFRTFNTNEATNQGWADHIAARLLTDFPEVEFTWWSPMNTYFTTNPGDGDAEDLVALDPWDTNPSSLTTWRGVIGDDDSKFSWNIAKYAIAQGYADGYGPWINLTAAITAADDRHPSEAPDDPVPNGQTHGGDILLAFFESGALGFAGNLLAVTPTFFTGTVTAGTVTLTGVLHVHAPVFFGGAVDLAGTVTLTGVLFSNPAVFPTGTVTTGPVAVTGTLFTNPPTFFTGTVASTYALTGTLLSNPPTFFAGVTVQDQPLTGTLYVNAPVFFVGVASNAGSLLGVLFVHPPTFFTGTVGIGAPSFWAPNPVAFTLNPVAFVKVGAAGPSPWGATLSGDRFEVQPLFPVGSVT